MGTIEWLGCNSNCKYYFVFTVEGKTGEAELEQGRLIRSGVDIGEAVMSMHCFLAISEQLQLRSAQVLFTGFSHS